MTNNKKRSRREVTEGVQEALERRGKFGWETIAYGDSWNMPDEHYHYKQNFFGRLETGMWRCVLATVGRLYIKVYFGAKAVGKKNVKALKKSGAVTVCNHFHYVDTLFVREAIGHFRSYHTLAPWNNKGGAGGHIVRHGGTLPFSSDIKAMRNFNAEAERLLKKGKFINFYPEHSMWWAYRKPRPMRDGAFHYAVKFGVPVLPLFCTFDKSRKGKIKKLRIHVLPPIYPPENMPKKQAEEKMKEAAEAEWRECYEKTYNTPLVYLCRDSEGVEPLNREI